MLEITESQATNGDLSDVVRSVFDMMVGLEVDAPLGDAPLEDGVLTAAVYITGQPSGAVVIHCPSSQACKFTGCFLARKHRSQSTKRFSMSWGSWPI
jgi:hypothetical protein